MLGKLCYIYMYFSPNGCDIFLCVLLLLISAFLFSTSICLQKQNFVFLYSSICESLLLNLCFILKKEYAGYSDSYFL